MPLSYALTVHNRRVYTNSHEIVSVSQLAQLTDRAAITTSSHFHLHLIDEFSVWYAMECVEKWFDCLARVFIELVATANAHTFGFQASNGQTIFY